MTEIKTKINSWGEKVTKWENNIHPDNSEFMQLVLWTMWEKTDGTILLSYTLDYNGKPKFIRNLTKEEIFSKYL